MRRLVSSTTVHPGAVARVAAAAVATALLFASAACGSLSENAPGPPGGGERESTKDEKSAGGLDKVRVGAIPIVDVAPLHLGKAKGFFEEQNIDLEVVNTTGGAAAVPGVVSGDFDFAFGNVTSLIIARSQNIPLKAIANGNASTGEVGKDFGGIVVPEDSPINSAKDLAGKTVAINNLQNISDTTTRASIRKDGGDPTGVRFSELPFPEMPAAVANHRVDAAMVVEPFLTIAMDQGAKLVASNFADPAPDLTIACYFTTEEVIAEEADLTTRFTAAIEKSLAYADEHPDEAREILSTYTEIDPAVADKIVLPAWPPDVNADAVQTLADLMYEDGLIKEKFDVGDVLP
ncbi:ABC transporter substrate-binding protein [Actinopolymorpha sp. B11F2]|uniref:ABC transporter substrate-binding protein n=1 Tax=Actinopolymorpha sp. B11F2 TaxID=3160862 RepID=UPI0032E4D26D